MLSQTCQKTEALVDCWGWLGVIGDPGKIIKKNYASFFIKFINNFVFDSHPLNFK
jgi:hypothetical protein